ncbi:MAG: PQQ-binding-like beta-propeller repeat protein, partial [Pirellulales bacterium]|nr:PQQ-binding-like beta-propeller repeat protein [Pirellulales bacterium]
DAFNGTILWKRPIQRWHPHLWPLKSGPAQLSRRLVAVGDRVYVTLNLDGPLVALDAATGETVRTYEGTKAAEEVIYRDGVLYVLANPHLQLPTSVDNQNIRKKADAPYWDERPRNIVAVKAATGKRLWTEQRRVLPGTLAADGKKVVFHDGQSIVCLATDSANELWRSEPVERVDVIRSYYLPTLVLYDDVVLFSGGETAGQQRGWYTKGKDTMTALSAASGNVLWKAYHPPSGYRSPEDLFVIDGLVWTGETLSGRVPGEFTSRDLHTGEVKSQFSPDVENFWFHHRCHRGKATEKYILTSRTGVEFIDIHNKHWDLNYWFRGACLYGILPANGLVYTPPHPCACYLEAKLYGFNALSATPTTVPAEEQRDENRLERGPAFDRLAPGTAMPDDWPTYRHDAARSGRTRAKVGPNVKPVWQTRLGGRLSSPVSAYGMIFVASTDTHTIHALDAASGTPRWQFTAGGRIDSPPTLHKDRVLFGSADGYVYCLNLAGELMWRFRAAPADRRLVSFEQVESVWPVHGSVLVKDDVLYCVSGRSMFLDGGLTLWRLDAQKGKVLSSTTMNDVDASTGKSLQDYISWLNMPVGLPDILSSDGRLIYMRSQPFNPDGTRLPLEAQPYTGDPNRGPVAATQNPEHAHLFCPSGFLDNTGWHRTYWLFGSRFVSGWCGYFLAGRAAPAGKILTFDESTVYGYGRKPKYYRWTTPMEFQLFAANKNQPQDGSAISRIHLLTPVRFDPSNKPVTVEAWVKADRASGVVLAQGGDAQGYVLYLDDGRPCFAVRSGRKLRMATGKNKVTGRWVHLAGVLEKNRRMHLYVNGKKVGSAQVAGLIKRVPRDPLAIGGDDDSYVGPYKNAMPFSGLIDEVKVFTRALDVEEIKLHMAGKTKEGAPSPALDMPFDDGKATDRSGNGFNGTLDGVVPAPGKIGQAMKFSGGGRNSLTSFLVEHRWTTDVPLYARAMVLTDGALFIAGPPAVAKEENAFKQIGQPDTDDLLVQWDEALEGKKGSLLLPVSTPNGTPGTPLKLDSTPVFDGLISAGGRLYMTTTDGQVICLGNKK